MQAHLNQHPLNAPRFALREMNIMINSSLKGSLYVMELDAQILRPLALNCLAYPTGLALSLNEKNM